jgi:hypothetical protein
MKKAMELPANFLVLMILGLIMFSAAVAIAYNVFSKAEEMQKQLDKQTAAQIERQLMQSNGKVLLGIASKQIKRGENDVFGIGIRNQLTEPKTFYLAGTCSLALAQDKSKICDASMTSKQCDSVCSKWIISIGSQLIESKDIRVEQIHVLVPRDAKNGEYWFDVQVCYGNPCGMAGSIAYDTVKKISVTVS